MEQTNSINENTVLEKYQKAIDYYWDACKHNKKSYKSSRYMIIILGSTVTLLSSFSSAAFIEGSKVLDILFSILTPLLAATLTVIGGFVQNFHWGATWRDMVMSAMNLTKARDLFLATKPEDRNLKLELDNMHNLVLQETKSFFQRVLDSQIKPTEKEDTDGKDSK